MILTNKLQPYALPKTEVNPKAKLVVLPETNFLLNAKHSMLPNGDILEVYRTSHDTIAFHPHDGRIYVNGNLTDYSARNRIYSTLGLRAYRDDYLNRTVVTRFGRSEELIIEPTKIIYKLNSRALVLDYDLKNITQQIDGEVIKTINKLPNSIDNVKLLIDLINELMEGE